MKFLKNLLLLAFMLFFLTPQGQAIESPAAGGSGAGQIGSYPIDIRENYFKRYPFARKAHERDATRAVTETEYSEISGKKDSAQQGHGSQGSGKLKRAIGWPYEKSLVAPAVLPYVPFIKYCDDNPYKGIAYQQFSVPVENNISSERDREVFDNQLTTFGLPMSDTQFQVIDRENNQRFLELLMDPERAMWMATQLGMAQGAAMSNSAAGAAESTFQHATDRIRTHLINIANDRDASTLVKEGKRPANLKESVAMVQMLYHHVFVPMAILFLLPGAVLTQVRSNVILGFFGAGNDDTHSPFEGILRAIIAIFLIPATQVIVSYSIDIGNTLADSVQPFIDMEIVMKWSVEQTYDTKADAFKNEISPRQGTGEDRGQSEAEATTLQALKKKLVGLFEGAKRVVAQGWNKVKSWLGFVGQGKAEDTPERKAVSEDQTWLSQVLAAAFNFTNYAFSEALIVLTSFQLVFMSYLFLLGPLAAAFFAWPQLNKHIFRATFGNWLNAVTTLSLWRFYWCVILAVMTQRVIWLDGMKDYHPHTEFEMMVFTCFMGMLLVVPFQPFNFDPGSIAESVLKKGAAVGSGMAGGQAQAVAAHLKKQGAPEAVVKAAEAQAAAVKTGQSLYSRVASKMDWARAENGSTGLLPDHASLKYGGEKAKKREQERQKLFSSPSAGNGSQNSPQGNGNPAGSPPPAAGQPTPSAGTTAARVRLAPAQPGGRTVIAARQGFPAGHVPRAQQTLPQVISMLAALQSPGSSGSAVSFEGFDSNLTDQGDNTNATGNPVSITENGDQPGRTGSAGSINASQTPPPPMA